MSAAAPELAHQIRIPLTRPPERAIVGGASGVVSIQAQDAPISEILSLIAEQHGLNIATGPGVTGPISVSLTEVPVSDALDILLTANGYTWTSQRDVIVVTKLDTETLVAPQAQGRLMRVFTLNYVSSEDADNVVKGLLSPAGKSFVSTALATDQRRTREQLVVEDLPDYVARIAEYVRQIDIPPLQVLIEAHVLQVELGDETRHGVDVGALLSVADADVALRTTGFANAGASPAFFFGIDGTDLDALLEALQTTTDAKTLASPKVLAVNGQEAKIQIGERFGYFVTTITQTGTVQDVNFLDTGIVLRVTPVISQHGRILMKVMPKISSGRVNPGTGLPEEETTDVDTTVLLENGQAMVIGGLISETDTDGQSKIPVVGDLWGVGRLFQRRARNRNRSEIIITLVPRVVPFTELYRMGADFQALRTMTPLTSGALDSVDRSGFEPQLPDAVRNPRRLAVDRLGGVLNDLTGERPRVLPHYLPTWPEKQADSIRP